MLTDNEKLLLEKMKDSRAVSEKLLSAFVDEEGALRAFLDFSKNKEELNICFRGNHNAIEIYYLNHVVWELSTARGRMYKVKFNFGHAKDMNPIEEEKILSLLRDKGFEFVDSKNIVCTKLFFSNEFVNEELWTLFKKLMDNNFDPNNGAPKVEKRWQHRFFKELHREANLRNGLYVYDLEYQQKMPHKDEILSIIPNITNEEFQHMIDLKKDERISSCTNEPDFMGVEFDEFGKGKHIVFGEIKSLYDSCKGGSGIEEHLKKMQGYLQMKELIQHRKDDAENILNQYIAIGDISTDYCFEGLSEQLKIKNILVLTSSTFIHNGIMQSRAKSAIDYYYENKNEINRLAANAKCEIWLIDECCDKEEDISWEHVEKMKLE